MAIGICPVTGRTIHAIDQLIARLGRLVRTAKGTRPKHRNYGSDINEFLGKNNSRVILTSIQNRLLNEIRLPENGFEDFKCNQIKIMHDGTVFVVGEYQGERTEFHF